MVTPTHQPRQRGAELTLWTVMVTVGTSSAYTCTPGPFGHNYMLVAGIVVLMKTLVTLYWAAARRFLVEMAALF